MTLIWVVEDHEKIRANMLFQLKDQGYRVAGHKSAESAYAALQRADERPPDLMLLDIRLDGMSGVDLIRRLSEQGLLPPHHCRFRRGHHQ